MTIYIVQDICGYIWDNLQPPATPNWSTSKEKKGWKCLTGNWKQQIKGNTPFSVFERLCLFGSNSTVICNVNLKYSEWTQGSSKKSQPSGQKNTRNTNAEQKLNIYHNPPNYNRNSNKSQNEVFLKFFATVCIYVATELRQQGCCALEHQHTLMRNQRLSQHQGGRALWLLPHSPPPTHSCCNDWHEAFLRQHKNTDS